MLGIGRPGIGDVRQTVDSRERFSDGTLRQFRWQIILYARILHYTNQAKSDLAWSVVISKFLKFLTGLLVW